MEDWIYDLVDEVFYYEVHLNPDYQRGEYDFVTDRMFKRNVEECSEELKQSGELPISNPSWQDEEMAHLMALDWMGSYFG